MLRKAQNNPLLVFLFFGKRKSFSEYFSYSAYNHKAFGVNQVYELLDLAKFIVRYNT